MSANPLIGTGAAGTSPTLLGMDRDQLAAYFEQRGERAFRAQQILQWVYRRGELNFSAMTDLSKSLRAQLEAEACLTLPRIKTEERSKDGTVKWLVDVGAGQAIETVFIPEPARGTLCISSQAGCALDCSFCSTAQQGFNRNLSSAEIIAQVVLANLSLGQRPDGGWPVTNVVFMGMGEPLANYRNVVPCGAPYARRLWLWAVTQARDHQHSRAGTANPQAGSGGGRGACGVVTCSN